MKAMVLAAGLGTRLRPLTNDRPKALVEVSGSTLLEIALARLRAFGIREVIINVHHFAEKMIEFLEANHNFGMRIEISREEELLETGGGLKKASWFFLEPARDRDDPVLVHNVDVLSTIDFERMVELHIKRNALATLAVQDRTTSRPLLFDERGLLRGRASRSDAQTGITSREPVFASLAFCGIHVISPRIFEAIEEEGAFSIIDTYARLAGQGEAVVGFRADSYYWRDLGKPESITQAERDIEAGLC